MAINLEFFTSSPLHPPRVEDVDKPNVFLVSDGFKGRPTAAKKMFNEANIFLCSHHRGKLLKGAANHFFHCLKAVTVSALNDVRLAIKKVKPSIISYLAKTPDDMQYPVALRKEVREDGCRNKTTQSNSESMNALIDAAR